MTPLIPRTLLVALIALGVFVAARVSSSTHQKDVGATAATDSLANKNEADAARFPVTIRPVPEPKRITTALRDPHGAAVTLDCKACHAVRAANRKTKSASELDEFHQGLKFHHGTLSCAACHDERDGYSSLHLADGTPIPFSESMRLCAQCHGPQFRDYQRGSHGGMTGHWDLSRGARVRNHCQHCHDPHSPAYPQVRPVAGPHDRFPPAKHEASHE